MSQIRNAVLSALVLTLLGQSAEAADAPNTAQDPRDALTAVTPAKASLAMPRWAHDVTKDWSPHADGLIHAPQAAVDLAWVMLVSQNKTHSALSEWRSLHKADLEGDVWIVHVRQTRPDELGHGLMAFISRKDGRFLGAYMDQ